MSFIKTRNIKEKYNDQLVFLLTIAVTATILGGMRIIFICLVSVCTALLTDIICIKLRKRNYAFGDRSTYVFAIAFALILPITIPVSMVVLGCVLAITIGKHVFGGKDNYLFSLPALSGAFLIITYPNSMLFYPKVGEIFGWFNGDSSELVRGMGNFLRMGNQPPFTPLDILLGKFPGPIGSIHILIIIVCGLCLIFRKTISASATLVGIGVVAISAYLIPRGGSGMESVLYELSSGYLLFGFVFLANDPVLLPKTSLSRGLFGGVLGMLTVIINLFGQVEGGFLFALLITNGLKGVIESTGDTIGDWGNNYLSSFEKLKSEVEKGEIPKLSDTQEIVVPKIDYESPPIEGKMIKIDKSKEGENE